MNTQEKANKYIHDEDWNRLATLIQKEIWDEKLNTTELAIILNNTYNIGFNAGLFIDEVKS